MANFKTDQVIAKIEQNKGNVAAVARAFGVSRRTILRFADEHPTVKTALADARESMLDNAESVLYKKVLEGSTAELIFFLKTQGRTRGYVERSEISGPNGGPVELAIVKGYVDVNPDDWDADES
jgi:hypothetical protein